MVTLRQANKFDATILYYHLSNPHVVRFSRLKPNTVKEMEEMIEYLQEEERENRVISRVIVDEHDIVIGLITLWDYSPFRREGFLATFIGEAHWGKGYNQVAKQLFFDEVFSFINLEKIYMLIRNHNQRSISACNKMSYARQVDFIEEMELREIYNEKIAEDHLIFSIQKENYITKEISS